MNQKKFYYLTRPILVLGFVSLFTDMASEMLYPVMPVYLESIGFSVLLISILEGFAETIAGLSKGYFGELSDKKQSRLPFVRLGYALSALSKPMLALFKFPVWIFFSRSVDRVGKGIRTAPRDALLSVQTTPENKAKVFGFHRGMDTLGAVAGPSLALLFLFYFPEKYRTLFLIAFIPGVIAVCFTFFMKESKGTPLTGKKISFISFFRYLFPGKNGSTANKEYRRLVTGLLLFALINSSDVLLLLKMKTSGLSDTWVIGIYIFYNLAYALFSFPAGIVADRSGLKKTYIAGLILFTIVYGGFAFNHSMPVYLLLFVFYGLYAACTEGIAKAWITNIAPAHEAGTAIGTYTAMASICAFAASSVAGLIWYTAGATYAFAFPAIAAACLIPYFYSLKEK